MKPKQVYWTKNEFEKLSKFGIIIIDGALF